MPPITADHSLPRGSEFELITKRLRDVMPVRLLMEKTFALNKSRSKVLTLGLRLESRMEVCAVLSSSQGPGVRLTQSELTALLNRRWVSTVLSHFAKPSYPGKSYILDDIEFRCVSTQQTEPALRIARKNEDRLGFLLLAEISVKTLFNLADYILCYVDTLVQHSVQCEQWVVGCARELKAISDESKILVETEREAEIVIDMYTQKMTDCTFLDKEKEFLMDLAYFYKPYMARMVYDYVNAQKSVSDVTPMESE
ncbi:uncharacterized protein LOC127751677 [Frankliniella occidentalis]|uniref:Uncharacterized protein LOC127751677 n=1 Tax=Frankliniella occidentalis TaxID=133901 RepID=A0A9C6X9L2_FRAOC|nr:uncharacterized protein LOC127751677 [Frankliniella occidentalis]